MRLKNLREEKRFTQKQIADAIGISPREYGHYETGYRNPKIETLIKMADFFDCSIDYLVERKGHERITNF